MKIRFQKFYPEGRSFSVMLVCHKEFHIADVVDDDGEECGTFRVISFLTQKPTELVNHLQSEAEALHVLRQHVEEHFASVEWPDDETATECPELKNLLKAEIDIIRKHLGRHMWFQHISDEQLAAMDFAKKFGWVMKELYCLHACKKRLKCKHAMELRQGEIEKNPDGMEG